MKKLLLERRLEFWKYQAAALTFKDAEEVAVYLIDHGQFPLVYQLLTSLYVLYGRPFKQRKSVCISQELVPSEYAEEHDVLMGLRDKLFAHMDTNGLVDHGISHLTKMLLRVEDGKVEYGMAGLLPIGFQYERIKELCAELYQACHERAEAIFVDAMDNGCPPANLTYEVDLREGESYLIRQAEWKKGSKMYRIPRR